MSIIMNNASIALGICLLAQLAAPATARAQAGPVAAYGFDEGAGTNTADVSGHGLSGTLRSATWTTGGYFGSAITFNGTNTWVTVADHALLDLTTGMTLEAWVKPSTLSGWRTVLMKEKAGDMVYGMYTHDNAPRPAAYVSAPGHLSAAGASAIPLNAWTHLATTYDGTTLRLHVNGVQAGTRTVSRALAATTGVLRIGGNLAWGEYFSGVIDEVRVYARALTATEIQRDMTTPLAVAPDTTPPAVSVTAPAAGSVLTGTVTVSATAIDNVGVADLTFFVDGAQVGVPGHDVAIRADD